MGNPVTLDFGTAVPADAPIPTQPNQSGVQDNASLQPESQPVTLDFSTAVPVDAPVPSLSPREQLTQDQDALMRGIAKGAGQTVSTVGGLIRHGIDAASALSPSRLGEAIGTIPQGTTEQLANRAKETLVPQTGLSSLDTISTPHGTVEKAGVVTEGLGEFLLGDEALKGLSIASRIKTAGMLSKVAKLVAEHPTLGNIIEHGLTALRGGTVATGQQLAHGATMPEALTTGAETAALGAGTGAVVEGLGAAGRAAKAATVGTDAEPGLLSQLLNGKAIGEAKAAEGAESGLRKGVQAAKESAGLAGPESKATNLRTIAEHPIESLEASAKMHYRAIDEAAGTDIKALRDKLSNTEYDIRQLTDTAEDQAKEAALEKARTGLIDKIEQAKQEAIAAGIPEDTLSRADAQYTQARALKDLEAKVLKNPSIVEGNAAHGSPEKVNLDSAIKAIQKLQDADKFGESRLEQALGKDGAKSLLDDLYASQREGKDFIAKQELGKKVWKYAKLGVYTLGGYEAVKGAGHVASLVSGH